MKIIYTHLSAKQRKLLSKEFGEFNEHVIKDKIGWGCVANITITNGLMKVAFMTPKEFKVFESAYRKNIRKVK